LCSDRIIEEVTMPNRSAEHSLTLTVDEAAALIGVSRSTAYDLVATDELPTVRLRRRILVPASALANLLGVSLVEVYGALSRLRGRTELKHGQRVGGSNGPWPERNQFALADAVIQPPARASDEPQLW
jgi:excisionase family DNA binding protein